MNDFGYHVKKMCNHCITCVPHLYILAFATTGMGDGEFEWGVGLGWVTSHDSFFKTSLFKSTSPRCRALCRGHRVAICRQMVPNVNQVPRMNI